MSETENMTELRRLLVEWLKESREPTGDASTCARCHNDVAIGYLHDWEDGDWCHTCSTEFTHTIRDWLPELVALAKHAEKELKR